MQSKELDLPTQSLTGTYFMMDHVYRADGNLQYFMADRLDGARHVWTRAKNDPDDQENFQKQVKLMEEAQKINWKFFEYWRCKTTGDAHLISMLFNGITLATFISAARHIHYQTLQTLMTQFIDQMSMYHNKDMAIGNGNCFNTLLSLHDRTLYLPGPYEKVEHCPAGEASGCT